MRRLRKLSASCDNETAKIYLRRAESSLAALEYECEDRCKFLYNALSYLNKVPGSDVSLSEFDHLYYSTEDVVTQEDIDYAWKKFHELAESVGGTSCVSTRK